MSLNRRIAQFNRLKGLPIINQKTIEMMKTFQLSFVDLQREIDILGQENVFLETSQSDHFYISDYQIGDDVSDYAKARDFKEDLFSYLSIQIQSMHLPTQKEKILIELINYINDDGYFDDFELMVKKIKKTYQITQTEFETLITIFQELEPEGIGAKNLVDCLLIQLNRMRIESSELRELMTTIITHYLTVLSEKKYDYIASKLNIKIEGVESIANFLKSNFDPTPGRRFINSSQQTQIIPSFRVKIVSDNIEITNLESKQMPQLSLSTKYLKLLSDQSTDANTKKYLQSQLIAAKDIINRIETRYSASENLVNFLVNEQASYFKQGPLFLKPLEQKEVARKLSRDPSVISRLLSSKFLDTPHGIISLKLLCPRNYFGRTTQEVHRMIHNISQAHPEISDSKIALKLRDYGISISRRTVNKYRNLDIPTQ